MWPKLEHFASCAAFTYPSRLAAVGAVFGRHGADINVISNLVLNIVCQEHGQCLFTFDYTWLNLAELSQKVSDKESPLGACFGFIDGAVRPIAHPTQNQREEFSGRKRCHAPKSQAVTLNGMIVHLYGPMVLWSFDWQTP